MKAVSFENIKVRGELAVRAGKNFTRLEGEWYRPSEVFTADQHGWPGDWEGRLILALSLLAQSTHREAAYLEQIITDLPKHLNDRGYLGKILPRGNFDEQQMAGHSWLLRGLLEYYQISGTQNVLDIAKMIVENLLLPAAGYYSQYPIDADDRYKQQKIWKLSDLQTKTKHHAETSDAGCAFIMLDGATSAYQFFGGERLKKLIIEMIGRYMEMDFCKLNIQTHATLSAARGIFRFYECTGDETYLRMAERIFSMYQEEALTEAYGNYNWFGVPRWTESCAILDSFILTVNLWKVTKKSDYLKKAHYILYNAIAHGQRENGGFGTDTCTGAGKSEEPLLLKPVTYDVYWCCNMRGGEGLSRAIQYLSFYEKEDLWIPFYNPCEFSVRFNETEKVIIKESGNYPEEGKITLKIVYSNLHEKKKLHFYLPSWWTKWSIKKNEKKFSYEIQNSFIVFDTELEQGDSFEIVFTQEIRETEVEFKNSLRNTYKYFYGPMLLGKKGGNIETLPCRTKFKKIGAREFLVENTEIVLSAIGNIMEEVAPSTVHQVMFYKENNKKD